ncbi:hypothetical protein RF11_01249 [Thelohanellus kitauei]|uniref:MD-2-related lipid-recognition domain-containing protein n=1 Tax=Thelohanellus kitauei TaxID=669202 RepID=A0A0C2NLN3_THEKT|nr:hypothetical protein RF11_01249 [Thelohanellus kitauei]
MAIQSSQISLVLIVMIAHLGLSNQQIFRCGLPIGDSAYYLKSVTMSNCTKTECRHYNQDPQTLSITFIPYTSSQTLRLVGQAYDHNGYTDRVLYDPNMDICSQEGMMCPVYPGIQYTVSINLKISHHTEVFHMWSILKLVGDIDQTVVCVKILSAQKNTPPSIPDC